MLDKSKLQKLRKLSGAPMYLCAAALEQYPDSIENALKELKLSAASADFKSPTPSFSAIVVVAHNQNRAFLLEMASDVEQALNNDDVHALAIQCAQFGLDGIEDPEQIMQLLLDDGRHTVGQQLSKLAQSLGCRLFIRRMKRLEVDRGAVFIKIEQPVAPNIGHMVSVVGLSFERSNPQIDAFGAALVTHVAANAPLWTNIEQIPEEIRVAKKWYLKEQLSSSGQKLSSIQLEIDKRLRNYYEEVVLYRQLFDPKNGTNVESAISNLSDALAQDIRVEGFMRFQAGEVLDADVLNAQASEFEWSFGNEWAHEAPKEVRPVGDRMLFICKDSGPKLTNDRDVVDLMSVAWSAGANMVVMPVDRLVDNFLPLSTRVAGDIFQKFATFMMPVAFVGSIEPRFEKSEALDAFIYETNRGVAIWFYEDMNQLEQRLIDAQVQTLK